MAGERTDLNRNTATFSQRSPEDCCPVFGGVPTNFKGTGCITGGPLTTVMIFHPGRPPDREISGAGPGKKKARYARRSNGIDAKKKVRLIARLQWETVHLARDLGNPDIFRHFSTASRSFLLSCSFNQWPLYVTNVSLISP